MGVLAGHTFATGSTTISSLPSKPHCILFFGTNQSTYDIPIQPVNAGGFFGYAMVDSDDVIYNFCEFAILSTGRCSNLFPVCARAQTACAAGGLGNVLYEGSVTEVTDNGFTITFTTGSSSHLVHWLAIYGIAPGHWNFYEEDCQGDNFVVENGFEPGVFFTLGQWRDSCGTFPKSTSSSLWNSKTYGDVSFYTSTWDMAAQSVIAGQWSSGHVDGPFGTEVPLGACADPFVLGSICTGVAYVSRSLFPEQTNFFVSGCGGGYDFAHAQFSTCFLGSCRGSNVGGASVGSETPVNFDSRITVPEAVIFNNFQAHTNGAGLNEKKRWGAGFATPVYNAGYSIDETDGSFYQSAAESWVAQTSGTFASSGTVNFEPSSGDVSLVVARNDAGGGEVGLMGIQTFCPENVLLLVSFSGLNTFRPSGSQITTRGGFGNPP